MMAFMCVHVCMCVHVGVHQDGSYGSHTDLKLEQLKFSKLLDIASDC